MVKNEPRSQSLAEQFAYGQWVARQMSPAPPFATPLSAGTSKTTRNSKRPTRCPG